MKKSKLPIGIDSFRTIRETGFHYVDKTGIVARLVKGGRRYLFARPRRFGKSLLVNTLKELFEGNEKLFRGLAIYDEWDWTIRYPVIHLTFSGNFKKKNALKKRIFEMLEAVELQTELSTTALTLCGRFSELIFKLERKIGQQVVVLVDDYDKPILDAISNPEVARKNLRILKDLYSALKNKDGSIRFCCLTGVSCFAQASLGSCVDHLHNVTLLPKFSSICGFTESDLDSTLSEEIAGLDREEMRDWYNGYCWLGEERVYNPQGILLLLGERRFKARWQEYGAPKFLADTLEQRGALPAMLEELGNLDGKLCMLGMEQASVGSLLLQTGYMTIAGKTEACGTVYYSLDFPNHEVRQSFNDSLLPSLGARYPSTLSARSKQISKTLYQVAL